MAGYVPTIASSVAFGIGSAAESINETSLNLEVVRAPINLTYYDFVQNKLVYKAAIPEDFAGKIYEAGIYSLPNDPNVGEFSSRLITTFDSDTETWLTANNPATFTSVNTRAGKNSLNHTPAASATTTSVLSGLTLDLAGYSNTDVFIFAYNLGNANTTSIRFRFLVDASNYYDFLINTGMTAGYKIYSVNKSSASVTGTPNWANISELQVITTSTSGGASDVEFDAVRIQDRDSASLDYILVARKVLSSPVTCVAGQAQDFEFTLDVNV